MIMSALRGRDGEARRHSDRPTVHLDTVFVCWHIWRPCRGLLSNNQSQPRRKKVCGGVLGRHWSRLRLVMTVSCHVSLSSSGYDFIVQTIFSLFPVLPCLVSRLLSFQIPLFPASGIVLTSPWLFWPVPHYHSPPSVLSQCVSLPFVQVHLCSLYQLSQHFSSD